MSPSEQPSTSMFKMGYFSEVLEQTLAHFDDAIWIGNNSPFAETYLISPLITNPNKNISAPQVRGEAVQKLIKETLPLLKQSNDIYYNLIEVFFLPNLQQKKLPLEKQAETYNWSRSTLYRYKDKYLTNALEELGQLLWQRLKSTLRLEFPPTRPPQIFGRDKFIENKCSEVLKEQKSIGLSGMGGIGKSSYGSYLANRLTHTSQIFWFTIRPGLNDHLSSLLFALGHFLHQQLQLLPQHPHSDLLAYITTATKSALNQTAGLDLEIALTLLRSDVSSLTQTQLIFCFDEIDLLRPQSSDHQTQLLSFLESLTTINMPMIFMAQQLPFEVDFSIELVPLSHSDTQQMLSQRSHEFSEQQIAQIYHFTQGNPRLLELILTLSDLERDLNLTYLPILSSVQILLERIQRRLSEAEQRLLLDLAIFQTPVPREAWPHQTTTIEQLLQRRLIQLDNQNCLNLLSAFKVAILAHFSPQDKIPLHLQAADIYAKRHLFTLAASHWVQAGQFEIAITFWYQHRQSEIEQGQGEIALAIFQSIPLEQLTHTTRELAVSLIVELQKLVGNYEAAQKALAIIKRSHSIIYAHLKWLEGDIARLQSHYEHAAEAYQAGLNSVEKLWHEKTMLHKNLAWYYREAGRLAEAWRESQLAQYEVENMQGQIKMNLGELEIAQHKLHSALELAPKIGYVEGIAKTSGILGWLYTQKGDYKTACQYQQQAIDIYEKMGRQTRLADLKCDLATNYILAGQPEQAIPIALEALAMHQKLNEPQGIAYDANTLSEAYLALHKWDKAEKYAMLAQSQEEDSILPDSLRMQGEIRLGQGLINEALTFFKQALIQAKTQQNSYIEGYIWRGFIKLYILQKQPAEAQQAYQEAIRCFDSLPSSGEVAETEQLWQTLTQPLPA